ncbi:Hypothetical predicted protein, partial [Paramuricea clavata]
MKAAAKEVCVLQQNEDVDGTNPVNCGISCDGTWQRRGHSSSNGCVTVVSIDTGKVHDVETLTTFCKEAIIELLNLLDITPGQFTEVACQFEDKLRVLHAEHKPTPEVKRRRKVMGGLKKQ